MKEGILASQARCCIIVANDQLYWFYRPDPIPRFNGSRSESRAESSNKAFESSWNREAA